MLKQTRNYVTIILLLLSLFYCDLSAQSKGLILDTKLKEWIKLNPTQLSCVKVEQDGNIKNTPSNLEALRKITKLRCSNSNLITIDELICLMPNLEQLDCSNNQITSLNLYKYTKLKKLNCSSNKLTNLDIIHNLILNQLDCSSNQLTDLEVSYNLNLGQLVCSSNQLKLLDISNNYILNTLKCCQQADDFTLYLTKSQKNEFTAENYCDAKIKETAPNDDLITDTKFKEWIKVKPQNKLPGVIVEADGSIKKTIANLAVLATIKQFACMKSNLTTIDELIRFMPNLERLDCSNNQITSLDLRNNDKLIQLDCSNNILTDVILSNSPKLSKLNCSNNKFIELDLRQQLELVELDINNNLLNNLDLSNNQSLSMLNCSSNKLQDLNVSKNPKLSELNCSSNKLTELHINFNPELYHLMCSNNQLKLLDINNNENLGVLNCDSNKLKSLDIDRLPWYSLRCSFNQLTTLDLNNEDGHHLENIVCNNNQLTYLDVSNCWNLLELYCCHQAEGFTLCLTTKQEEKFSGYKDKFYCNATLKVVKGIEEDELLELYPNPASDKLFIKGNRFDDEVQILSLIGKVLLKKSIGNSQTELDISSLPTGIYIIKTHSKIGKLIKK